MHGAQRRFGFLDLGASNAAQQRIWKRIISIGQLNRLTLASFGQLLDTFTWKN